MAKGPTISAVQCQTMSCNQRSERCSTFPKAIWREKDKQLESLHGLLQLGCMLAHVFLAVSVSLQTDLQHPFSVSIQPQREQSIFRPG